MKFLLVAVCFLTFSLPVQAEPFQARFDKDGTSGAKVAEGQNWYKRQQRTKSNTSFQNRNTSNLNTKSKLKGSLDRKLGKQNADAIWSNLNQ